MSGLLVEEIEKLDRNFLTTSEVSKAMGISTMTFYRNYESFKFPVVRSGKRFHIPKKAFLEYLKYGKTDGDEKWKA